LEALEQGTKQRQGSLHEEERPTALLTSILVNVNRNPKKSKPAKYEDYCFYMPHEAKNLPSQAYGSAAMRLMANSEFPSWALFIYKDLKEASGPIIPAKLALRGENAIILAPEMTKEKVKGMLVALEPASDKWIEMKDDEGHWWLVQIPELTNKVTAQEDVEMSLRFHPQGHSPNKSFA
jgi:hypothetical protein